MVGTAESADLPTAQKCKGAFDNQPASLAALTHMRWVVGFKHYFRYHYL